MEKEHLERPFEEVLESGKPDFPFCLGWANHSWTTYTWNSKSRQGKDSTIFEQLYLGVEDYTNIFMKFYKLLKINDI